MGSRGNYGEQNGKEKPTRKSGEVGAGDDVAFRGYINLELSAEDKERFGSWLASDAATSMFDAAVTDGCHLSLKRDPKTAGGFLATATNRRADSPNAGLCVTARAKEPQLALWRLVYCLELLYTTGHWEDRQAVANPDRW